MIYQIKDIPGFPGYRVDTDGMVWSCLEQIHEKGSWGLQTRQTDMWKKLNPCRDGRGYVRVYFFINGKRIHPTIHKLVLNTFVSERPNKMQCRHLNGVRTDNRLANLQWGTVKENHADKKLHGTHLQGETISWHKLTESQVHRIRLMKEITPNIKQTEMAKFFNVSKYTISDILLGKSWKHI